MKRIPRIKFPERHPKPSSSSTSGIESQTKPSSGSTSISKPSTAKSDVPTPPGSLGGKASLQPKRIPVSEKEMEAILLGGCI